MKAIAYSLVELTTVILVVVFYDNENSRFVVNFYVFDGNDVYSSPISQMYVLVDNAQKEISHARVKRLGRKISIFITKILAFGTRGVYELRDSTYTVRELFDLSLINQFRVYGAWPRGHERL